MTIPYNISKQIIETYQHWDKFSMLVLSGYFDELTNRKLYNNCYIIAPNGEWDTYRYAWKLHNDIILEYLETDIEKIARTLYDSIDISNEQKVYLKMKWNFQ